MGRTGKMFAAEHFGVVPDVVLLAKGIASGMPLGAMMAPQAVMTWPAGSHGSTCAGNPVRSPRRWRPSTCSRGPGRQQPAVGAALEVEARASGSAARQAVEEVRGLGPDDRRRARAAHALAEAVAKLCFRRGLLVLECGKKAIRLSPPLLITEAQAGAAAEVLAGAIADARPGSSGMTATLAERQAARVFFTWTAQRDAQPPWRSSAARGRASRPRTGRAGSTSGASPGTRAWATATRA